MIARVKVQTLAVVVLLLASGSSGEVAEGADYLVVPPADTWRWPTWPMVAALAGPGEALASTAETLAGLTRDRGALLVVFPGSAEGLFDAVLRCVRANYPVEDGALILLGRQAMAAVAWAEALRHRDQVAGLLTIDAVVSGAPPAGGTAPGRFAKACLLVLNPDDLPANRELSEALRRQGVACAVLAVEPAAIESYLGLALTHLLPPPPGRTELYDPATGARLAALPGWQFVRHDRFLAVARPVASGEDRPIVEIATGELGKRSFENYVAATLRTLQSDPGIVLLRSERLSPVDSPLLVHAFLFTDHRAERDHAVYWLQVGHEDTLVSFRSMAPLGHLEPHLPTIRALALGLEFTEPE